MRRPARHDGLVGDAIETHGGYVVFSTGTEWTRRSLTASDAVDAAVVFQSVLGSQRWARLNPLRVRAGIHSGPAEVRDDDYYGTAVNQAARMMSIADGGQMVVSAATQELTLLHADRVRTRRPRRAPVEGPRSQPERIFQVVHPHQRHFPPPLRSLDAMPGKLEGHFLVSCAA